ncbi:MAG: hypothetical protein ACOC5T_03560 [Elusimicrobiota bacterium]
MDEKGNKWVTHTKIPVPDAAIWELENVSRLIDDNIVDDLIVQTRNFIRENGDSWGNSDEGRELHDKIADLLSHVTRNEGYYSGYHYPRITRDGMYGVSVPAHMRSV